MKDIFSYNKDEEKTALMNWRTSRYDEISNFVVLAEGYMMSSLQLTKDLLNDNELHKFRKEGDSYIFPIIFNVNHGIELYLKSIIWSLNKLLENNASKPYPMTHDIKKLYKKMLKLHENFELENPYGNQNEKLEDYILPLSNYVEELFKKIEANEMDFARYPTTVKEDPHFYIRTIGENIPVDLENFYERFKEINEILHGVATMYIDYLDKKEG